MHESIKYNYFCLYQKVMKLKGLLFIGIIFLVTGIMLKITSQMEAVGLVLIITGVIFKTIYILAKVKSGDYTPGKEMIFLVIGLIIFLTGLYMRGIHQTPIKPSYLIILGLTLKVIFIIRFIQIVQTDKKPSP